MKIMYQIIQDWSDSQVELLSRHNIKHKKGLSQLHIDESKYNELKEEIDKWGTTVFRYPLFSKKEIEEPRWRGNVFRA